MSIEIVNRYTKAVLYKSDKATLIEALPEAIRKKADLSGADLSRADLSRADLSRAYLRGAYLRGARGLNPLRCTPLRMLLDQVGKIRAYKLVKSNGEGPYNGGIKYELGKIYTEARADTDETIQCASGLNVATLDWCMSEWKEDYKILLVEFTVKDIAVIPTATDGKFRLSKLKVIREMDLVKIGLVEEEAREGRDE